MNSSDLGCLGFTQQEIQTGDSGREAAVTGV